MGCLLFEEEKEANVDVHVRPIEKGENRDKEEI
jgi:hypothetical protein